MKIYFYLLFIIIGGGENLINFIKSQIVERRDWHDNHVVSFDNQHEAVKCILKHLAEGP